MGLNRNFTIKLIYSDDYTHTCGDESKDFIKTFGTNTLYPHTWGGGRYLPIFNDLIRYFVENFIFLIDNEHRINIEFLAPCDYHNKYCTSFFYINNN